MRMTLLVCLVSLSLGCTARRNILLITVDTLRRDALGVYDPRITWTPTLDSLARAGTLWLEASAPWSLTHPSHATMMTGLYPSRTGVRSNEARLDEGAECLAEVLGAHGWVCAGLVNTWVLEPPSGIAQGFAVFEAMHREPVDRPSLKEGVEATTRCNPRADRSVRTAMRWIDKGHRPFFLWLHLMDPHLDYDPPAVEASRVGFDPAWEELGSEALWKARRTRGQAITEQELAMVRALYDGEVAAVDRALGHLFAHLRLRELHRSTVVAVVSDHGESIFDDGGYLGHAHSLHESVVAIPLIMSGPGVPSGVRITTPVELVQLRPTLLRLARGRRRVGPHDLFSGTPRVQVTGDARGRLLASWGSWRMIVNPSDSVGSILSEGDAKRSMAVSLLDSALRAHRNLVLEACPSSRPLNARDVEELKALGYLE